MANHKRRGPKSTRSGCLLCKPHKHQAEDVPRRQELRARLDEAEQRKTETETKTEVPDEDSTKEVSNVQGWR